MNARLRCSFAAAALLLMVLPAQAQQSPFSQPNSVSGQDLIFLSVGYLINAQRICGVRYDPARFDADIQMLARSFDMSPASVLQKAQEFADYAAPQVTEKTCREAPEKVKRFNRPPDYKPPEQTPPAPNSLSE
ncbi:hypothetical protein [Devosia sp. 1566]|uniref:hypothetical protein n=1 Tax=Devosia sp. 1566 TaxID=2499144 RepID=UPI000FD8F968|nr:hypothetical protein [Devosia sp. 1566]